MRAIKEMGLYAAYKRLGGTDTTLMSGRTEPCHGSKKAFKRFEARTDVTVEECKRLYAEGLLIREIAERLGCSVSLIQKRLADETKDHRSGLSNLRARRTDVTAEMVNELLEQGLSRRKIAERFGCSRSMIEARVMEGRRRGL